MKQCLLISVLFVILVLATSIKSYSQGVAINNDGSEANGSAMLDITSTNSGLLIPRMTAGQRGAITSPANGLLVFQTDGEAGFYYYTGSSWLRITNANDASDFVSGTGTLNYVPKWTPDGVTIGNSQIFDDGTNVGIGTTSPTAKFHVSAPASGSTIKVGRLSGQPSIEGTDSWMMIEQSGANPLALNYYGSNDVVLVNGGGNVGIGTTSPSTKLHVNGTVRFQGLGTGTQTTGLMIDANGNVTGRTLNIANWDDAYSWGDHAAEGYLTSFSEIDPTWNGAADQTSTIGRTGNVGIGTTSPAYKLDVRNGAHVATNSGTEPFIVSRNYKTTNHEEVRIGLDDSNLNFHYVNDESASRLNFRLQNTDTEAGGGANASDYTIMTLSANSTEGRVGIGTTNPSTKLHVNGTVRFQGLGTGTQTTSLMIDANGNVTGRTLNIANWDDAYSWGDHAAEGYLTSFSEIDPTWNGAADQTSTIGRTGNVGIGTTTPTYPLEVTGDIYANGGWMRVSGDQGIYFQSHGGGFYMTDATWIRTYNNKSFYQNTGIMRTDGTFQVGASGATLNVPNGGNFAYKTNVLFANTAGNVGVGNNSPTQKLHITGNARVTGAYYDSNNESGNSGEVLSSTTTGTDWTKAQTIQSNSATVTAGNWYRIASNSGNRADASFTLRDQISGGGHSTMRFHAGVNYGFATGISFSLLSHSIYSTATFTKVRIIRNGTYDGAYLEIFCARSGNVSYDMFDNFQSSGWTPVDWTAGSIPGGWTAHEYETDRVFAIGISDDALSLTRSGNLGINTASPNAKLDIKDHTNSGIMLYLTDDNNSTGENAHKAIQVQTQGTIQSWVATNGDAFFKGNVGVGTTAPSEKLHVVGNAKATGYIVAGTATTGSTTRYGSETIKWEGSKSVEDGTVYQTLGTFSIPNNIPAGTTIYVDRIVWECDGFHEDGNESYSIHVKIGSSIYYGWNASASNGATYVDWHYDSGDGTITNFTTNQTLTMKMSDSHPTWGGDDELRLLMMHVTVYYHYSSSLQPGDIAASGRIYANNTQAVGDLAEHFEYDGPTAPGFVVSYVPGSDNEYELCNEPYSNHITGVISENPSVVLNSPEQGPPLALAGRVTVKLVDSDELIKGGDFITSSSIGGYGMKAKRPGPVIGYATKNQIPGENFVEVLLQPGKYYIPPKYIDDDFDEMEEKENQRTGKW